MAAKKSRKNESSEKDLVIAHVIDAPRDHVFKAWTESEHYARWWGPKHLTAAVAEIEPRVGGRVLLCVRTPDGRDFCNAGEVREVVEPSRLAMTLHFSDVKGNTLTPAECGMPPDFPSEILTTVTFEESNGGTKLIVRQNMPPELAEQARAGWNQSLDKLAADLANS